MGRVRFAFELSYHSGQFVLPETLTEVTRVSYDYGYYMEDSAVVNLELTSDFELHFFIFCPIITQSSVAAL